MEKESLLSICTKIALTELNKRGKITRKELRRLFMKYLGITEVTSTANSTTDLVLSNLVKASIIKRIGRGKYINC